LKESYSFIGGVKLLKPLVIHDKKIELVDLFEALPTKYLKLFVKECDHFITDEVDLMNNMKRLIDKIIEGRSNLKETIEDLGNMDSDFIEYVNSMIKQMINFERSK
jgi:hypothetical protein